MKTLDLKLRLARDGYLCAEHPAARIGFSPDGAFEIYLVRDVRAGTSAQRVMSLLWEDIILNRGAGRYDVTYADLLARSAQPRGRASTPVSNSNSLQKSAQTGHLS